MKRVLVTGGAGFIGSNFIRYLLSDPSFTGSVVNIDKLTYAGNLESLSDIEENLGGKRYFFKQVDICDVADVKRVFSDYSPDTIVNFAAESHVDRSIDGPMEFIQTNIVGTAVLLQNALELYRSLDEASKKVLRFHHVSTDEVYGSLGDEGFFYETTPYDPNSPYSASKASSDHLVRAWHHTFGLPVTISNCSNNYGPYQFPEKLIPLMILNCLAHKPLPVYGRGLNVRDWLYVTDHCEAIRTVIEKGKVGETYNIGGNNELRNIDIVHIICEILDELVPPTIIHHRPTHAGIKLVCHSCEARSPSQEIHSYKDLVTYVQDRPGHDLRYAIDASKIKQDLGWEPKETFSTAIRKTISWYLENRDWWKHIQNNTYQQQRLGLRF